MTPNHSETGKVTLVGAGPGDPGLLTLKGARALQSCDVVLYDYLVDPYILDMAPAHAERLYVGKMGGHKGADARQSHIHDLIVERANQGLKVVRLKGGDPFVFGRGGEEVEVLKAAGVPFEVVPGVTSAVAVPAYAGIPVTHRNFNTALAIVTGHEDPRLPTSRTNWRALASFAATGGTLVILMGVKNLKRNMRFLIDEGVAPDMPAALVRWGTRHDQKTLVGCARDIAQKVEASGFGPPAVCVLGPVVALREKLAWFEPGPLSGMSVLLTRDEEASLSLASRVHDLGGTPLVLPTIEFVPPEDPAPLRAALANLTSYDWVAFTSARGVRAALDALDALGLDARAFAGVSIACVGRATAAALKGRGLEADLVPTRATAAALAAAMRRCDISGTHVLAPLAEKARPDLKADLEAAGAHVDVVVAYRNRPPELPRAGALTRLKAGGVSAATFASPSAVTHLAEMLAPVKLTDALAGSIVVCIGPVTAEAASRAGLQVAVVPETHKATAMIDALAEHVLTSD